MKQLKHLILFFFVGLSPILAQQENLSLNGYWKFNSLLGEGTNSLDITPTENDILIDNSDESNIEYSGNWKVSDVPQRGSKMWGEDYFSKWFYTKEDAGYFRFKTGNVPPGYYEHFIYYPWGHHNASIVNVTHKDGVFSFPFCQRNRTNTWLSLGIFRVTNDSYIEFTAYTKGMVSADVIMLRPVTEKRYTAAQQEKAALVHANYDDSNWETLKVPGHFGMLNEYANYSGKAWYRRAFTLPDNWEISKDERIRIRFDGVYHVGRVFVNGTFVGKHQGGFTPFEFDITDIVNADKSNLIAVEADNSYTVGATWNWGGIIRDVTLIKNSPVRVAWQYIHAEPDLEKGTATYEIKLRVENNSKAEKSLNVKSVIRKDKPIEKVSTQIIVPPNSVKEFTLQGKLAANQVALWHFDKPELYHLDTTIEEGNALLHKKTDRFGIRKFEASSSQMFLNGEAVRLVGFNRVSDHRYWGSSEPEKLLEFDVDMMKTAGANFMRIMHGTQNKKLIELCDEKGILIFEEVNIRDIRNPQFTSADFGFAKQWIREMIERDSNHPSIMGWSVGNELDDHWDYVKTTYAYAKKLDPYRMALHVSNVGHRKGENASNNPLNYGDMIFQNIYHKNPTTVMDSIRARWPNKAIFISEFGYAPESRFTTPSLDNAFEGLSDWYQHFRKQRPFITGASIWTYNDYRSGYTQSLPSENRAWGMVNAWRTKRRYFDVHQNENSPAKDLLIENLDVKKRTATVSIMVRDSDDFPSYIMDNYTLEYHFTNQKGDVLFKSSKPLPTLVPYVKEWKGTINWKKLKEPAFALSVALVSTNGYTRRLKTHYFNTPSKPKIALVKASNDKVRVYFTKTFDKQEHFVRYSISGSKKESYKTIANHIDLEGLPANEAVEIQLFALNAKGESMPSETVSIRTTGKILPPIVWNGFIDDNKLIVGYSGAWEDQKYTIRYGATKTELKQSLTSNTKGMMTIPLNGEENIFFQVKRITSTGESQWSNTVEAKKGKFRLYE